MANSFNSKLLVVSIVFIAVISVALLTFFRVKDSVDQKIEKYMDVTGDGIDDEIIIHIKGKSWEQPFTWTLTIVSNGKKVFEHESDDTRLDISFNDKGYVNDTCASYIACKKQYYLTEMRKHLFIKTDLSPTSHVFDRNNPGSIYTIAKQELMDKFHLCEADANKTVDGMVAKLKSKQVQVLYVPVSPVLSEFPRMYVDRVGTFVTIYQW